MRAFLLFAAGLAASCVSAAEPAPTEADLRAAMAAYTGALASGGGGVEAYAGLMSDDYSRWRIGGGLQTKDELIATIVPWYAQGNRVGESDFQIVSFDMEGDHAFVRENVVQTYVDPDGNVTTFTGHIATVWRATPEGWRLIRSDQIAAAPDD